MLLLGGASFVSVEGLLRDGEQLAAEAGDYVATIDDYTNDVSHRDGLALALGWASDGLTEALRPLVEQADEALRNAT